MRMLVLLFAVASCGCMATYHPRTMAGAQCKKDCAMNGQQCVSFGGRVCSRHYNACVSACRDIEELKAKGG